MIVSTLTPRAFGEKSAASPGLALAKHIGKGLSGAGKATLNYGVPVAGGGLTAGAIYQGMVPEDANAVEKVEGGLAAGLLGMGAGSVLNPRALRNATLRARRSAAGEAAKGLSPDFMSHLQKNITKDVLLPKARYAGLALVPGLAMSAQRAVSDIGETTGNIKDVSSTWKDLATSAGQTDGGGENIVDKVRKAVQQVAGDAATASGAVAQGAKDISGSLSAAAKSTEGAAVGAKEIANAIAPITQELAQKDDQGNSVVANMSSVLRNLGVLTDPETGDLTKNVRNMDKLFTSARKYAPHVAGASAGALGLYALYKLLKNRKKKPAAPSPRPSYGY